MAKRIEMSLPIEAAPKDRPRFGGSRPRTTKRTRGFESAVAWLARRHPACPSVPLDGPLKLTFRFYLKRPQRPKFPEPAVTPDADNYLKALMDALNGVLWTDDARICRFGEGSGKYYDLTGGGPRIELTLEEIA